MIELLIGSLLYLSFNRLVACDRSMALVERLRTDLARVVDSHQSGRVSPPAGVESRIDDMFGRVGPGTAPRWCCDGAQGIVGAGQEAVQRR